MFDQIITSADKIEQRLNVPITHFAYSFGDIDSFSSEALKLAQKRFEFIHTGLRGNNIPGKIFPWAIRRHSFKPNDSKFFIGAILEGALKIKYNSLIRRYESWGG